MIINGTAYSDGTKQAVIDILEQARATGKRIRIFLGKDGKCWNEENYIIGRVGRSTGTSKVPLLIHNSRSMGGPAISADCIVRIDTAPGVTAYRDETVRFDSFIHAGIGHVYNETTDKLYARCRNGDAGERLAAYMNGTRWSK